MKSVFMMLAITLLCFVAHSQESNLLNGGQNNTDTVGSAFIAFEKNSNVFPSLLFTASQTIPANQSVIGSPINPVTVAQIFLGVTGAVAVAAATVVIVNEIYEAVTDQGGETTTEETTNDGQSSESQQTTSDTDNETETESESQMSGPKTPKHFNIGNTSVKNVFSGNTMLQTINQSQDGANILLADKNIKSINFRAIRTIKTELKRKSSFPKEGVKLQLNIDFDKLAVFTEDNPKTFGSSSMITVTVSGNGKTLYTFKARIDQGKIPLFSDAEANKYVVKGEKGVLIIKGFKKRVEFNAEPGRSSDNFVVTILTEGIDKRI